MKRIEDDIQVLNETYIGGVYSSYDMAKAFVDGQKNVLENLKKQDKHRLNMTQEIELQIMPSGNVAVYRGYGFIPAEKLTEEEKEFIIDRIADELGVNTKGDRETFAEHYGCIPEYEKLENPKTRENDNNELQQEESVSRANVDNVLWNSLQDVLALGFIHFLNENRQDGKMCLSNAECQDIMDAFLNKKWERIKQYSDKYLLGKKRLDIKD